MNTPLPEDALSTTQLRKIDQICDRFDAALQREEQPKIEDFVLEMPDVQSNLLQALIRVEIDLLGSDGPTDPASEYSRRFPEHASWIREQFRKDPKYAKLLDEFERELVNLLEPRIEDFVERFSDDERRREVRAKLILVEIEVRRNRGEDIDWGAWEKRFPEDHAVIQKIRRGVRPTEAHAGAPGDAPSLVGKILGDYQIVREIGRGGMGIVFEARDINLNTRVAVKVLPLAGALTSSTLIRFQNEAKSAAQLKHRHIVPVYAYGVEDETHYYAMRYIDGNNLASVITTLQGSVSEPSIATASSDVTDGSGHLLEGVTTRGSTSSRQYLRAFIQLGIQAADALQYSHDLGIVHRDIKPANLLLDSKGDVWVADFGLAQMHGQAELTAPGDFLGTLRYMSPEQAYAKRVVVDHRTDIFSLGVTLYELLTLRTAFDGDSRNEILTQVAFSDPPSPRRVNRGIPDELSTIVMKAIAKSPDERYQTAGELAADLLAWQNGEPILARRPSVLNRVGKWAKRHRSLAISVTVTSAIVIMVTIAALMFANQTERKARQKTEAKNDQLLEALATSEGRRLITLASIVLPQNPGLSAALASIGAEMHGSAEADRILLTALDANHERLVLRHHDRELGCAAYSPDGRFVITTESSQAYGLPRPTFISDAESGEVVTKFAPGAAITSAAFGPRGERVLTASTPTNPYLASVSRLSKFAPAIWDVNLGTQVAQLQGAYLLEAHPRAFSPSGTRIVAPAVNNTARVYDAAGVQRLVLSGHESRVTYAAYSPDGTKIVTSSADNTVRIWDSANGVQLQMFDLWRTPDRKSANPLIRSVEFGPRSKLLLTCAATFGMHVWNVETGERRDGGDGTSATFSPNGEMIAVSYTTNVRLVDTEDLANIHKLEHEKIVRRLQFSPDGKYLATSTSENKFRVWDTTAGKLAYEYKGHRKAVTFVDFHPNGQRLISASSDATARIWNLRPGRELAQFDMEVDTHHFLTDFNAESKEVLLTSRREARTACWNRTLGDVVYTVPGRASIPADEGRFVTTTPDRVTIWDYADGAEVDSLQSNLGSFRSARINPQGSKALVVLNGGPTWIWDWANEERKVLVDSGGMDAIFHPSRDECAAIDKGFGVRIWDTATGLEIGSLDIEHRAINLEYNRDGSRLMVITDRHTGYIFDADTRTRIASFGSPSDQFNIGRFSHDSRFVVTYGSIWPTIYCWNAEDGELISSVESPGGRIVVRMSTEKELAMVASDETGLFQYDYQTGQLTALSPGRLADVLQIEPDRVVLSLAQPDSPRHITIAPTTKFKSPAIETWTLAPQPPTMERTDVGTNAFRSFRALPDSKVMLVGTQNYKFSVFEAESRRRLADFVGHGAPISFAKFFPDGKRIVTCSWDQTIVVWNRATQQPLLTFNHGSPILAADLSRNGERLVTGGRHGDIIVWDMSKRARIRSFSGLSGPIEQVAFGGADRLVARSSEGHWCEWNVETAALLNSELEVPIRSLEYSPRGVMLIVPVVDSKTKNYEVLLKSREGKSISLSHDEAIKMARFDPQGDHVITMTKSAVFVWDASTGEKTLTVSKREGIVARAAIDESGRLMTHHSSSISVWDENGTEGLIVNGDGGFATADIPQPFSPDGQWLIAMTPDKRVRLIPLSPTSSKDKRVRALTATEKARFHLAPKSSRAR